MLTSSRPGSGSTEESDRCQDHGDRGSQGQQPILSGLTGHNAWIVNGWLCGRNSDRRYPFRSGTYRDACSYINNAPWQIIARGRC